MVRTRQSWIGGRDRRRVTATIAPDGARGGVRLLLLLRRRAVSTAHTASGSAVGRMVVRGAGGAVSWTLQARSALSGSTASRVDRRGRAGGIGARVRRLNCLLAPITGGGLVRGRLRRLTEIRATIRMETVVRGGSAAGGAVAV